MERYFSIGEAARLAHTTTETLRHYDRIGLVRPSRKDAWTKYRYYSEQDIIRLDTVRALRLMDLPLSEIGKVLAYDDLQQIVDFLDSAERRIDEKISALQDGRSKIERAKADYTRKLRMRDEPDGTIVRELPERVILLSDTMTEPTADNLWSYLGHFYEQLPADQRDGFSFEDMAGVYTEGGSSRLFAVCVRHAQADGLRTLPKGRYLCAGCTEEERERTLAALTDEARTVYGERPRFTVQLIVVTGILQWNYEAQVYIGE